MAHRALERRRMLGFFVSGGAALVLGGCGGAGGESGSDDTSASSSDSTAGSTNSGTATTDTSSTSGASGSTCIVDPTETEGPYPGDGSNRVNGSLVNVLAQSGVVRSDIRSSFGSLSGTAEGLPMTLKIAVVNVNNNCAPLTGYAVYLWHCTRGGEYSLYSSSIQNQNYLRGVQVTDSNGQCAFVSIFPGCYDGRWPHIHFELYQSANTAMSYSNKLLTSQMAMPMDISRAVYAAVSGYSASVSNLARISLASDNVFSDNTSEQIAWQTPTFTGDTTNGYTATITIGIAV
ncbi:intradiol ring-cleavage dioxygenase [Ottowia thiooxydans]|uniref:dioxygenase family protein n=1 Tax=Ottowia thiooxydans TaxID=219182 RepID=UPI000A016920|nr:intradiol ring-cleavage dioxygenase [Ottowia thiooxydans]